MTIWLGLALVGVGLFGLGGAIVYCDCVVSGMCSDAEREWNGEEAGDE